MSPKQKKFCIAIVLIGIGFTCLQEFAPWRVSVTAAISAGFIGLFLGIWNFLKEPARPNTTKVLPIGLLLCALMAVVPTNWTLALPVYDVSTIQAPAHAPSAPAQAPAKAVNAPNTLIWISPEVLAECPGAEAMCIDYVNQNPFPAGMQDGIYMQPLVTVAELIVVIVVIVVLGIIIYQIWKLAKKIPPVQPTQPPENPAIVTRSASSMTASPLLITQYEPVTIAFGLESTVDGVNWVPECYGTGVVNFASSSLSMTLSTYSATKQLLGTAYISGTPDGTDQYEVQTDWSAYVSPAPPGETKSFQVVSFSQTQD